MRFEWDAIKATANLRKHGVSFEEASTVFNDMSAREAFDHLHSDDEDRFHLSGISEHDRLLVVSYCYRKKLCCAHHFSSKGTAAREDSLLRQVKKMTKQVDFSHTIPNPHFEKLSREVTFRLDFRSIEYFYKLGEPYGLDAEEMMCRYLRHLAGSGYSADLGLLTLEERKRLKESLAEDTDTRADA